MTFRQGYGLQVGPQGIYWFNDIVRELNELYDVEVSPIVVASSIWSDLYSEIAKQKRGGTAKHSYIYGITYFIGEKGKYYGIEKNNADTPPLNACRSYHPQEKKVRIHPKG